MILWIQGCEAEHSADVVTFDNESGEPATVTLQKRSLPPVDKSLTYDVVRKRIKDHIGKRVQWRGKLAYQGPNPDAGEKVNVIATVFFAQDSDDKVYLDKPYVAVRGVESGGFVIDGESVRVVVGTVAGSAPFTDREGKKLEIPRLEQVTITLEKTRK